MTHLQDQLALAESLCQKKGLRLTSGRRRVLELILSSPGGVKAYDLLDQLTADNPSARPPTIYRAIDFLLANRLIHRIESLNAYVGCSCPDHHQAFQLLICRACGQVAELHEQPIDESLNLAAKQAGFIIEKKHIEIHGLCRNCVTHPSSLQQESCDA